jgi:hypothetical protein
LREGLAGLAIALTAAGAAAPGDHHAPKNACGAPGLDGLWTQIQDVRPEMVLKMNLGPTNILSGARLQEVLANP